MNSIVSKKDFPSAGSFVYLNAANVGLMYSEAEKVIKEWHKDLAYNGSNNFDENAEERVFKKLHIAAAALINAEPDDIAVGSSTTELLCSLAWAVSPTKDQNVVSTETVFPSTIYPWQRVAKSTGCEIRLAKEKNNFINTDDIIALIDHNTAVVSISHVEYANGQLYNLELLADAVHAHNALLVVDATQSAGAIPIDIKAHNVDVLISGAYKWLCGPFGSAFMYLTPYLQEILEPGLVGFRSHENMWDLDARRINYVSTAAKFEFSTMAFGCALGFSESIDFIYKTGVETIFQHNKLLSDRLIEGMLEIGAKITSPLNDKDRTSIVRAHIESVDTYQLKNGLQNAQIFVSTRGNSIRFSPHLYNTLDDIDKAINEIKKWVRNN